MTLAELKTLIENYVQNSETTFVATLEQSNVEAYPPARILCGFDRGACPCWLLNGKWYFVS